jgi:RNA polymerase sigma factor (sigma-70 family)
MSHSTPALISTVRSRRTPAGRPQPARGQGETPTRRALIARAQAGESAALDALLIEHAPLIAAMAGRYARADHEREDLAQEARIGLLAAISRFDPNRGATLGAYAHWLVRRAVFEAARALHREDEAGRVVVLDMDQLPAELTGRLGIDPLESAQAREQARALQAALGELTARDRLLVALRFGLSGPAQSLEQAARILGCRTGEVRADEERVLGRLRGVWSAAEVAR